VTTMADVARLAGVSISTVSYALNGTRPISAETRARIEAAMAELHYTPNAMARGLRGRRAKIIALVYPSRGRGIDISSLGYILGASDHAQSMDYHLLLWTTETDSLASLRTLVGQGLLDGVLLDLAPVALQAGPTFGSERIRNCRPFSSSCLDMVLPRLHTLTKPFLVATRVCNG